MGAEKAFENRVKDWLKSEGIYPAGCPEQEITIPACGWYFKVWGGGKVYQITLLDNPMELNRQWEIYLKYTGGV